MKLRYKKDIFLIGVGAVLFAAFILAPFMIRSSQQSFIVATSSGSDKLDCVINGTFPNPNQCMSWIPPESITILGWIGAVLLIAYIIGIYLHAQRMDDRKRLHHFITWQAITALGVTFVAGITYMVLRSHSQAITIAANQQPGESLWIPVREQLFGPGLAPASVVILAVLYVVGSCVHWYALKLSPWRIAGVKKEKLFQ